MTRQLSYQALFDILDNDEYGITPYFGYSGRCMYGETCIGFTASDLGHVLNAIAKAMKWSDEEEDRDTLSDMLGSVRTDSLGMEMIVYFPGFDCDEEDFAKVCDEFGIEY